MKKKIACLIIFFVFAAIPYASAQDLIFYPTLPGSNIRDYSKPGVRVEGNNLYPTLPGTTIRDYSRPGLRVEGNNIYPTLPGTNIRDYMQPGWTVQKNNPIAPITPGMGLGNSMDAVAPLPSLPDPPGNFLLP